MTLSFFAPGVPQPKGSTRAFVKNGRAIVTSDNPKAKAWARVVNTEAWRTATFLGDSVHAGPVAVVASFRFKRPGCHRNKSGLRSTAPESHTVKPDTDKLVRCLLDALTGIAYEDDAQVVEVNARKRYCLEGEEPGVEVIVRGVP